MTSPASHPVAAFPVEWSEIRVTGQPFTLNRPEPATPLDTAFDPWFRDAIVTGFREAGIPMRDYETIYPNHFAYSRMVIGRPTPEQVAAIERALRDRIDGLMDRWLTEYRPRVEALVASLKAFDPETPPLRDLPALLDAAYAMQGELWTIHFRIVVPMTVAMQLFGEFCADLLDSPNDEAHAMLPGGLSETVTTGFAIADLADLARRLGLADIVLATGDDDVLAALGAAPEGETFLAELGAFVERYGYRQEPFGLATPTWLERPELALAHVRAWLRTDVDAREQQARVVREAEAAANRARERLAAYPQAVREQFETMLAAARHGAFLQEEHHALIDLASAALLRLNAMAVGRRLVRERVVDTPEDVVLLDGDELRRVIAEAASASDTRWARDLVRERRAELEVAATMTPPPYLGDPAGGGEQPDTIVTRGLRAHFGGPPVPSERPGELRGMPASRGVATGRARVARSLREGQAIRPGEILVAMTTLPTWTPLFGVAAGVVTETGGALSHCAVAAREYGIPAVVGVHGATRTIPDGAVVTVDGAAGTVRVTE